MVAIHQQFKSPPIGQGLEADSDTVFQILKFKLSSFRNRFHNGQPQHPKTKSISSAKYKSLIRISVGQISRNVTIFLLLFHNVLLRTNKGRPAPEVP